uniref:C2H2-type domain-containing protein n=1 Tax=Caenorhabditis japonica TaxID=281687 RepID=A0A8R1EIS3_CAEJA
MPYRPEAELKRPDLKGEFLCGHCGKTFCHAASLNRHRLNFHGDDQQCTLCHKQIPHNDTVRRHMQLEHNILRVFTCGCCNWTFPDKKELHAHNNSMAKTGQPGNAQAIAVSGRTPGECGRRSAGGKGRARRVLADYVVTLAYHLTVRTLPDHLLSLAYHLLSLADHIPSLE